MWSYTFYHCFYALIIVTPLLNFPFSTLLSLWHHCLITLFLHIYYCGSANYSVADIYMKNHIIFYIDRMHLEDILQFFWQAFVKLNALLNNIFCNRVNEGKKVHPDHTDRKEWWERKDLLVSQVLMGLRYEM